MLSALKTRSAVLALLLLACAAPASASALRLDPGFGRDGWVRGSFGPRYAPVGYAAVSIQADGSILASRRSFSEVDGSPPPSLHRFTASGDVDPSFRPRPASVPEAGDELGRRLQVFGGPDGMRLQRLLPDGAVDRSYGPLGTGRSAPVGFQIDLILALPSGAALVAGGEVNGEGLSVARLDSSGAVDSAFGEPAVVRLGPQRDQLQGDVAGLVAGAGGRSYVLINEVDPLEEVGHSGAEQALVVALDAEGRPDPGFAGSGLLPWGDSITAFSPLPGGGLLLAGPRWGRTLHGGYEAHRHRGSDTYVARFDASGALAPGFGGGDGLAGFDLGDVEIPRALLASAGGEVTIGGAAVLASPRCRLSSGVCDEHPTLLRLRADGSADPAFGGDGVKRLRSLAAPVPALLHPGGVLALAEADGGWLIVAGRSGSTAFLTKLEPSGSTSRGFGVGGVSVDRDPLPGESAAQALAVDSEDRILLAGRVVAAGPRHLDFGGNTVVRYRRDGSLDRGFGDEGLVRLPDGTYSELSLAPDARGGAFVLSAESFGLSVIHLDAGGELDRGFGEGGVVYLPLFASPFTARRFVRDRIAALPGGGVLVTGWNKAWPVLVRLEADGSPSPSFGQRGRRGLASGPFKHSTISAIAVTRSGAILLAGSVRRRGENHRGPDLTVFELQPDGDLAKRFGHGGIATPPLVGSGWGTALAALPDGDLLVAGQQQRVGPLAPVLLRLDSSGRRELRFRTSAAPRPSWKEAMRSHRLRQVLAAGQHVLLLSRHSTSLLAFSAKGNFEGYPGITNRWENQIIAGAARGSRVYLASHVFHHRNFALRAYCSTGGYRHCH